MPSTAAMTRRRHPRTPRREAVRPLTCFAVRRYKRGRKGAAQRPGIFQRNSKPTRLFRFPANDCSHDKSSAARQGVHFINHFCHLFYQELLRCPPACARVNTGECVFLIFLQFKHTCFEKGQIKGDLDQCGPTLITVFISMRVSSVLI